MHVRAAHTVHRAADKTISAHKSKLKSLVILSGSPKSLFPTPFPLSKWVEWEKEMGKSLELVILKVFPNPDNSMILFAHPGTSLLAVLCPPKLTRAHGWFAPLAAAAQMGRGRSPAGPNISLQASNAPCKTHASPGMQDGPVDPAEAALLVETPGATLLPALCQVQGALFTFP